MTDSEFATWSKDLFVSFPSLWEWLQKSSPDPKATQAKWRDRLRAYSLEECAAVVRSWSSGEVKPFEAYERDKVHLIVSAFVGLKRDRAAKRREMASGNEPYLAKLRRAGGLRPAGVTGVLGTSKMVAAYEDLRPVHKKMLDGEITQAAYDVAKIEAMEKHGFNKGSDAKA